MAKERVQRNLTGILVEVVVCNSRMFDENEEGVLDAIT